MNFLQLNAFAKLIELLQEKSILFITILLIIIMISRGTYTLLTSSSNERIFLSTELNAVINFIKYTSVAIYTVVLGTSIVKSFNIVNSTLFSEIILITSILFYLFFLFFYFNSKFRMFITKFMNKKARFKWCVLLMVIANVWCISYLMLIYGTIVSPIIKTDPLTNPIEFLQNINEGESVIFLALFILYCIFIYPLFLFYFKAITTDVRISLHLKSSIQIHNKYLLNPKVTNGFILIGDQPRKRECNKVTAVSLNEIEFIDITTTFTHWNKKTKNIANNRSYSDHVKNIKSNKGY